MLVNMAALFARVMLTLPFRVFWADNCIKEQKRSILKLRRIQLKFFNLHYLLLVLRSSLKSVGTILLSLYIE